jgi:diguanylate cyclase (GGDEF)-like protein
MERSGGQITLLEAARTIARGGELDAKLEQMARHVRSAAGASAALIYLLDPVENVLLPAAVAGLDSAVLESEESISVDDPRELVARAVRERRAQTATDAGQASRALSRHGRSVASLVSVPLVAADEAGGEDAEGALLASFDGPPPDPNSPDDTLTGLADMCAVAIRNARLEHALLERADWMDRLATTDSLTGLANRATLLRMLDLEIARATRQRTRLSVVIFDIDGMSAINERAGANVGDDVLRLVASTLADQVRLVDTIGRLGRDELAMIAPGGGGTIVGRRVQEAASHIEAAGDPLSLSVGVAALPETGGDSEQLMAAASAALVEAKRRGRGQLVGEEGA